MLTCDRFLFLHLHKSGGTFVNELIRRCLPGVQKLGYHLPYSAAPQNVRHLPVLGTVRNPLGYYVSWYHFQLGRGKKRNALFNICSQHGTNDFASTIERLVTIHDRPDLISDLMDFLPENFVDSGINITRSCLTDTAGGGLGFYSWLYRRHYRGAAQKTILPTEDLRNGLNLYLERSHPESANLWREYLIHAPDMNVSHHSEISGYYNRDLRRLVERRDELIFSEHGY